MMCGNKSRNALSPELLGKLHFPRNKKNAARGYDEGSSAAASRGGITGVDAVSIWVKTPYGA